MSISAHVLTEDVLYREVTANNRLLSRRLLTKTNRLPAWAERVFPGHVARAVYVLEDSVVDPHAHTLTTTTWNLNHNTLMVRRYLVDSGERPLPPLSVHMCPRLSDSGGAVFV